MSIKGQYIKYSEDIFLKGFMINLGNNQNSTQTGNFMSYG